MASSETTGLPKHVILFRDWKEQVEARDIDDAIGSVFDGISAPHLYDADTGQDVFAIVVSATAMTLEQVQAAWEARRRDINRTELPAILRSPQQSGYYELLAADEIERLQSLLRDLLNGRAGARAAAKLELRQ